MQSQKSLTLILQNASEKISVSLGLMETIFRRNLLFCKIIIVLIAVLLSISVTAAPGYSVTPQSATPSGLCSGFTDTGAHDYFCFSLRWMYDRGYISGYNQPGDCPNGVPCFKPDNPVTRGQFCKILANSFGWTESVSGQTFSDVPPSHEFYPFIQRAVNRGVISGYTGTDCTNYGWASPCFRPYNNVTRGQMAKIVANAAGFNDDTTSRLPSYYDVPTTHPFFSYIERLVMHVANGPQPLTGCGNTNTPCFFPWNDARRSEAVFTIQVGKAKVDYPLKGQSFGYKTAGEGVWVYLTTPNPPIPYGSLMWQAAPAAVTDRSNLHYMESGPIKACNPSCGLHPFGAWGNGDIAVTTIAWNVNLSAGSTYAYKSEYAGGGIWQAQYCTPNCTTVTTRSDLGVTSLPYVAAGSETGVVGTPADYVTVSNAQHRIGPSWTYWCHDPTLAPFRSLSSTVTSCTNASWTANILP